MFFYNGEDRKFIGGDLRNMIKNKSVGSNGFIVKLTREGIMLEDKICNLIKQEALPTNWLTVTTYSTTYRS